MVNFTSSLDGFIRLNAVQQKSVGVLWWAVFFDLRMRTGSLRTAKHFIGSAQKVNDIQLITFRCVHALKFTRSVSAA